MGVSGCGCGCGGVLEVSRLELAERFNILRRKSFFQCFERKKREERERREGLLECDFFDFSFSYLFITITCALHNRRVDLIGRLKLQNS